MVKCEDMNYYMSLYFDSQLTAEEEKEFQEHILSCEKCRQEFEEYKMLFEEVRQLPEYELPSGFHEEVMGKIREEKQGRAGFNFASFSRRMVPAAASMIGMFVLLSALVNSVQLSNDVPQEAPAVITAGDSSVEYYTNSNRKDAFSFDIGEFVEDMDEAYAGNTAGEVMAEASEGAVSARDFADPEAIAEKEFALDDAVNEELTREELTGKVKSYNISITAENVDEVRNYILNLTGRVEYEYAGGNYASVTKRISQGSYEEFIEEIRRLEGISITYASEYISDNRNEINDVNKRMNSLLEEHEKLVDLMGKAENVSDLVTIEQRISTVEQSISSYNTQLSNFAYYEQYPEVSVNISQKYSAQEDNRTMAEKIRGSFISGINGTARGMENIIVGGVYIALPLVLILAIIAVVMILIKGFRNRAGGGYNDKK